MWLLMYTVKVAVSTFIIYFSIKIATGYNYRNTLQNALITALILSVFGGLFFFAGLIFWVFILINWYNIGFFRSFLCVVIYGVINILLSMFLAAALIGGAFTLERMTDPRMYSEELERMHFKMYQVLRKVPEPWNSRLNIERLKPEEVEEEEKEENRVKVVFKNGRSIKATIIMEGQKGYLVDIADGNSEVVLRKDLIDRIEEVHPPVTYENTQGKNKETE